MDYSKNMSCPDFSTWKPFEMGQKSYLSLSITCFVDHISRWRPLALYSPALMWLCVINNDDDDNNEKEKSELPFPANRECRSVCLTSRTFTANQRGSAYWLRGTITSSGKQKRWKKTAVRLIKLAYFCLFACWHEWGKGGGAVIEWSVSVLAILTK